MSSWVIKSVDLINLCSYILEKVGIKKTEAKIAAEIITSAEMRGVRTHGISSLPLFVKRIQYGGINPRADIEIVKKGHNWAVIDGHSGMGQLTAYKATKVTIDKARKNGIAIVGVRNGMHFGAAAYYSIMIANEDMIGISMSNTDPIMTITGSASRVIGSNPFSYAAPAGEEEMVVFDIAMSAVAAGKIKLAREGGKDIPLGWLLDSEGKPTTDPKEFDKGGTLLPFGGHKGYGLALMIEILAGVITGNALTKDICGWYDFSNPCPEGFSFIAINIDSFMPVKDYKKRMDDLIKQIRNSPKATGVERIYLPGEIEQEKEEKAKVNGIILNDEIVTIFKNLLENLEIKDRFNSLFKEI